MATSPKHDFCIIDTCPCPLNIAPYIYLVLQGAGATADSIYRGDDARDLLNKYGHHSQYQLYHATPAERQAWGILGTPDEPGFSTHEQFSDGVAYPAVPRGGYLQWWQIGFDVPDQYIQACIRVANGYGWNIFHPYNTGVEYHHLNFKYEPKPSSNTMAAKITHIRNTLPRS